MYVCVRVCVYAGLRKATSTEKTERRGRWQACIERRGNERDAMGKKERGNEKERIDGDSKIFTIS